MPEVGDLVVTTRDDLLAALAAGRRAAVGAINPHTGVSLTMAKVWRRGYESMLLERFYGSPDRQAYLEAHPETRGD